MNDKDERAGGEQMPDSGQAFSLLERLQANPVVLWIGVFALTVVAFYLIDHLIMTGQGLPLNLDLSPAQ